MFIEIFIYLVVAFGILILCITMLEKDECTDEKCIIINKEGVKVKVIVEGEGLSDDDIEKISCIMRRGKYIDIYDVATSFEILNNPITRE